jgi:hypothetical protein
MKKFCKECENEKNISDFYLKKDGKPKTSYCKSCYSKIYKKEYNKEYYENNKDKFKENYKKWIEENDRTEYRKKYWEENKEILKEKNKEFRENNKELVTKRKREYYKNLSPEKKGELKIRKRELYHQNNYKEKKGEYVKEKLDTDPFFKLKFNIRSLIRNAFKRGFTDKSKKTVEILGCSFDEFKLHIESQFDENMNWENQGSYWHMDHIIPISSAETEEDVYRLNHYTNFQPLYWLDNIRKGDKL